VLFSIEQRVGECQQDIAGSGKGKDDKDEGEEDSQGKARNNSRDNDEDNAATRRRQWRKGNSHGDKGDGDEAASDEAVRDTKEWKSGQQQDKLVMHSCFASGDIARCHRPWLVAC
jgi:hypothetical protein